MSGSNTVADATIEECIEILAESYAIIDSVEALINATEDRMAQLELEARLSKPFLALVKNDE